MHWTERELILSRRDVLQDKFIGRRILINTFLLYRNVICIYFELGKGVRDLYFYDSLFLDYYLLNLKVALLSKVFNVVALSREIRKNRKSGTHFLGSL